MKKSGLQKMSVGFVLVFPIMYAQAGTMGPIENPDQTYISVFGGGGSLSTISLAQLGTAYYTAAKGGPLAVNAFGVSNSRSEWMVGGNVGHAFADITSPFSPSWSLKPAAEIEGYYIGKNTITGDDVNNSTARLTEHNFLLSYPTSLGVGLINAVVNLDCANFESWHPYIAGGVGIALSSITNADSTQTAPYEAGINHYNSDPSDSDSSFAAQAKAGLHFDFTKHLTLFGEYRYLYVASTNYMFGSTVYPTHVPTSNWNVKFGSESYNMGVGGIRYVF